jgi:hypothetical protein
MIHAFIFCSKLIPGPPHLRVCEIYPFLKPAVRANKMCPDLTQLVWAKYSVHAGELLMYLGKPRCLGGVQLWDPLFSGQLKQIFSDCGKHTVSLVPGAPYICFLVFETCFLNLFKYVFFFFSSQRPNPRLPILGRIILACSLSCQISHQFPEMAHFFLGIVQAP